ncbi:hypothetical protein FB446DRAFT_795938 [Lentinula raphanica]|nr:hypothetical protein FB446DRAFT_795938 [Lentinula raphanica]
MRSKTASITKKSSSTTPERRLSRSPSPFPPFRPRPRPRITYGKRSKNRSSPTTPMRLQSPPVASSSTLTRQPLTHDEPILIPDSPVLLNVGSISAPVTPSNGRPSTSFALGVHDAGLSTTARVLPKLPKVSNEPDDDEPVLIRQLSPSRTTRASTRESKLKDALKQTQDDLKVALQAAQDAQTEVRALLEAQQARNECPCCTETMFQPFILSCGHTCCKDCLIRLKDLYLKAEMNFACPSCRTIQGRFTPIPNYICQADVDEMVASQGAAPPDRQPLEWPEKFQSAAVSLPFTSTRATFPVPPPVPVPAPFPIEID